ncbi:MAG: 50S ribosomal protein L3 [Candidatus Pacearchaeota archaeon]|nr:50S ribosomal protein L3 [Candidatus Pacearchaeota archaeon]
MVYCLVKEAGIKKSPDIAEIGLGGSLQEKLDFIKRYFNKEIRVEEILGQGGVLDVRGLTKGLGIQGPVKRFGISLRQHKSEKGRRRPGTLGPWHPARVTFRTPMAGQKGFFSRAIYNLKVIGIGTAKDIERYNFEFPRYGRPMTSYVILKGSVQGPAKRQLMLTLPLRETKRTIKKKFDVLRLLK